MENVEGHYNKQIIILSKFAVNIGQYLVIRLVTFQLNVDVHSFCLAKEYII